MFLRKMAPGLRPLASLLAGVSFAVATGLGFAVPAHAVVTVTRELVDVDFTTASQIGSTITNAGTDKTSDLTVSGTPTGLGTNAGLTFANTVTSNTNQYITGNLGNTTVMSEIVVEFDARFPDTGCAAQPNGSMVFGLGTGAIYIPYNIYRHSNFIGFNTFSSDIYGITIPDTTDFHSYKFVMVPGSSPQNAQEIWVDGVQQSLSQQTTSAPTGPCSAIVGSENPASRIFTNGTYTDGGFMLMSHPLLATNWGTTGTLKNIRITTTDTYNEPDAPSIDSVTAGDGELSIAFTVPESDGGSAITDYDYSTDNGATWVSAGSTSSPIVVTGLANGTTYNVKLRAVNVAGDGAASTAVAGTPTSGDGPTAPLIDEVVPGDGELSVYFAPPADDGGLTITDYEYSTDSGVSWVSAGSTSSPIVITGLTNGTSYSVLLRAVTSAGPGESSASVSSTPSEDAVTTLPRTGVEVAVMLLGSLAAIITGTVLLAASRRSLRRL